MDATLTDITDAQAAEIMLTLPWQFGDLNEDGEACYGDDEIQTVIGYVRRIAARAEAAEAKETLHWSEIERMDVELATAEAERDAARQEAASLSSYCDAVLAEVARLRAELGYCRDLLRSVPPNSAIREYLESANTGQEAA